ncbi:major facilitator superfamily domain-containing protein [Zychaea mexicana]|uniref:major facilitator superfamily domain-containing protein n=1 Tax=Zychaea mexicana TaxID=64656 RepID=UPI0022FF03C3|nr:major facilitator superfamily domain-containing protein [Zychaea mexicana]KAI9488164.1 major facilitator superfamily domain-containing protein [Zychaea mexicana]
MSSSSKKPSQKDQSTTTDGESQSLLWSAASSMNQTDYYYDSSSTSSSDGASTMSYATFHTVKEPEQHLIDSSHHNTNNSGEEDDDDDSVFLSSSSSEHNHSSTIQPHEERDRKHIHLGTLVLCLCISVGMLGLDTGIVLLLLNIISTEFQSPHLAVWIHLPYLFGCLLVQPLCRNLADAIGRKALLVIGQCLFLIGSLSCSATQNMLQMIAARAVAGLGGGILLSLSSIVVLDCLVQKYHHHHRRRHHHPYDSTISSSAATLYERYDVYIQTAPALGLALGPYVAGLIMDLFGVSWHYCFYVNLVPCLITLCLYLFWLPNYTTPHYHIKPSTAIIANSNKTTTTTATDYFGAFLFVVASISLITGVALGGNYNDWNDPVSIALFSVGGSVAVVFLLYEALWAGAIAIMPGRVLLRNSAAIMIQFCAWSGFTMMLYLLPQFFMGVKQHNAPLAGLWVLPHSAAFMIATLLSGCCCYCVTLSGTTAITRHGSSNNNNNSNKKMGMLFLVTIMAMLQTGMVQTMAWWWKQDTPQLGLVSTQAAYGFASGVLVTVASSNLLLAPPTRTSQTHKTNVLQRQQQRRDLPLTISTLYIIRTLGELAGVAAGYAILQCNLKSILAQAVAEPEIFELVITPTLLPPAIQSLVQQAMLLSIQRCFLYYGTACAALCLAVGVFCMIRNGVAIMSSSSSGSGRKP